MSLRCRLSDALTLRVRARDLATLRARLALAPGTRLLDVGGGTGVVAAALAGDGGAVVLEPDPRKAAWGRARRPGVRFLEGVAERLPFPAASFDAVLVVVAWHHVHGQERALAEIRRVLRPGGRLAMLEVDPGSPPGRRLAWMERHVLPFGARFLAPGQLRAQVEAAGFVGAEAGPASRGYLVAARAPGGAS